MSTRQITSLEEHRTLLSNILQTASERVVIISPLISSSAIFDGRIHFLVKETIERGVSVSVYINPQLNKSATINCTTALAGTGIGSLRGYAGASVTELDGIYKNTS